MVCFILRLLCFPLVATNLLSVWHFASYVGTDRCRMVSGLLIYRGNASCHTQPAILGLNCWWHDAVATTRLIIVRWALMWPVDFWKWFLYHFSTPLSQWAACKRPFRKDHCGLLRALICPSPYFSVNNVPWVSPSSRICTHIAFNQTSLLYVEQNQ